MEYNHDYECEQLPCIVDFLHPIAFRAMPAGRVGKDEIRKKLSKRDDMPPEHVDEFTKFVRACYDAESTASELLFSYGNNRDEIVDRFGREVASCETCQRFYGLFLDAQIVDSQRNPDLNRGPYENREEADFDFANIGPSVNEW